MPTARRGRDAGDVLAHSDGLADHVPADIELMFHFCYGDSNHKHVIEPTDMGDMVDVANRLTADVKRTIQLIHMPVPRDRSDDAYFAPLKRLQLKPETELCLGLVHYTDGSAPGRKSGWPRQNGMQTLFDCHRMRIWPAGPCDHPGFAANSRGCSRLNWDWHAGAGFVTI